MTESIDAKSIGLGEIAYDHSINDRLAASRMNLKINQSQEKLTLKIRKADRDAHIIDPLKRDKSEDQKTLSRLEKEYDLPEMTLTDQASWEIRKQTLGTIMSNLVDNVDVLQMEAELKIRREFIAKIAGLTTKKEKEKLEKANPDAIFDVSNLLARRIMGVADDASSKASDSKSNTQ